MYKKIFEEIDRNGINEEMLRFFFKRTKAHINAVKIYAGRILRDKNLRSKINPAEFVYDINHHDKLKYEDPEFIPYVKLTWKHKLNKWRHYKKPGTLIDSEEINQAILHHIKKSKHHPEYWSNQVTGILNKDDRDEIPEEIVDATNMPLTYIASMVADWMAMAKELHNNPYEWAEKNIGKRWRFTKEQTDFIYDILDIVWK